MLDTNLFGLSLVYLIVGILALLAITGLILIYKKNKVKRLEIE